MAWNCWLEEGSREDISDQMHNIIVPVSIISGAADKHLTSTYLYQEFHKYFKNADFVEVAEAAHLIPLEQAVDTSLLISSFVSK